ncbi:MAG: Universal stress protein [Methanocella sp. PtaU1.Bin125]|nr:MAG: Universal stress protein [Methanocella sp. PtaU1.Bin125]
MKILIATDGSKNAGKAVDYGTRVAAKMGAEVLGVYVINLKSLELFALAHHDSITGYEEENAKHRREGEEALEYLASQCKQADVKCSTLIARGYPADEIIKIAEKEKPAMIVVGSLGKSNVAHMLMGSVSESIMRKAPFPVLVVRGDVEL